MCPLHDQPIDLAGVHLGHYETANISLSNGSNIINFCSVFVKIWILKFRNLGLRAGLICLTIETSNRLF